MKYLKTVLTILSTVILDSFENQLTKPSKEDNKDINKAIKILNRLNPYNYSQGTVVRNNKVIVFKSQDIEIFTKLS